jgi:ATP-binding cassette, subfamily B, bacterial PglK
MFYRKIFLARVIGSIREVLPAFVSSSIARLLPLSFLLSIFEIVGLVIIVPVIQILLKPEVIHSNPLLSKLYILFQSSNEIIFIVYLLTLIVLFFVVKNILFYWASFRQTRITYGVAERLTTLQFEKYLYQPYSSHVKDNTSVLLRKIIEIPYNFTNGIMLPVVQLINEIIVMALIIFGILLYNSLLFISMVLFITPFFIFYARVYKNQLKNVSHERERGHSDMFRKGKQSIEGFREILLFNKFSYFQPAFGTSVNRFTKAIAKLYHLNLFSPKIIETLAIVCVLVIFVVGLAFQYNIEKLVAFLGTFAIAAYRLIPSVNKMVMSYNNIRSSEFVFDHFRTVKWDQPKKEISNEDVKPLSFTGGVELKNISFSFYQDEILLNNVNLTICKGEIIGVMGKSGSGKSTLINVLLGLYAPSAGKILVDGTEVNEANIVNWHKTISFVPQSPVLLEGTIEENIAFGITRETVDKHRLKWAIENSGLTEFIESLPLDMATHIGDKSLNISGGQKQRIAIARALYHNGKILIFDEATSSLDLETEEFLTSAIKKLASQSYTVIIIAHRKETLKYCDRIYKIKDGKISGLIEV